MYSHDVMDRLEAIYERNMERKKDAIEYGLRNGIDSFDSCEFFGEDQPLQWFSELFRAALNNESSTVMEMIRAEIRACINKAAAIAIERDPRRHEDSDDLEAA